MRAASVGLPRASGSIIARLRERLRKRAARWARQRQGADPKHTELSARRVYILPTGIGLVFACMTFAMLLGSMNYNNNLSFLLTFMLTSLGFVAMHHCQRNLVGIEVSFAGVEPVFAGQSAKFRVAVSNPSKHYRQHIQLYTDGSASAIQDIAPGESRVFTLDVPTAKRGLVKLPRYGVRTLFPFEMFRAWTWLHMDLSGLVYPRLASDPPEPPASVTALGHRQHDARGEEDFAGLREFHAGDSPRHVAWKAYARSENLLSKRFSGADTSSQWLDYATIAERDLEARLSILARWTVDADRRRRDYGVRLPGEEFAPTHGDTHRHRVLSALALFNPQAEVSPEVQTGVKFSPHTEASPEGQTGSTHG